MASQVCDGAQQVNKVSKQGSEHCCTCGSGGWLGGHLGCPGGLLRCHCHHDRRGLELRESLHPAPRKSPWSMPYPTVKSFVQRHCSSKVNTCPEHLTKQASCIPPVPACCTSFVLIPYGCRMADAAVLSQEYLPLGHMRKPTKAPPSPNMGHNGKAAPAAAATPAGPPIAEDRSVSFRQRAPY